MQWRCGFGGKVIRIPWTAKKINIEIVEGQDKQGRWSKRLEDKRLSS